MTRMRLGLGAVLLVAAVVAPVAPAASGGPKGSASASVKKQVSKLKRKVNELQQRVDEVSKQPGPQGPTGDQGEQGPAGAAGSPDTGAQILGKLGVGFLDVNSTTVADPSSGSASEQVLVDGPAFDLVGRCTDNAPAGAAEVVVRSGSEVAQIGVDSQASGGVVNDFTPGTPPPDQRLLFFVASPNQIESGSYSVAAINASGEPFAQMTGMVSAGPFADSGPGFNDCFFSVTAIS